MDGCSHRGEHQEFNGNMQPCVHRSGDQHFVLAVDAAQVVTAAVHNKSRAVFTVCFLFTYTPSMDLCHEKFLVCHEKL
jgi:hypothetical protein